MDALIEAAKAEGTLTVYGSCEEAYLSAACQQFEKLYGIKVDYQRLSTGEVYTKIQEENGSLVMYGSVEQQILIMKLQQQDCWSHMMQ